MANQDIEESFKSKTSNKFYRYYFDEKSKQIINCWSQLIHFYYDVFLKQEASEWLFRGDIAVCDQNRSMREAFKTSLDKAFEEFDVNLETPSKEHKTNRNRIEEKITRAFRRRAHLLTGDKESTQTQIENLALLRHHGAPARILDWMYSFFTAVYFAMNRDYNKEEYTYTVWALNRKWLNHVSICIESNFLNDREYLLYHFAYKKKKGANQKKRKRSI